MHKESYGRLPANLSLDTKSICFVFEEFAGDVNERNKKKGKLVKKTKKPGNQIQ
jgi:hypothetical protein